VISQSVRSLPSPRPGLACCQLIPRPSTAPEPRLTREERAATRSNRWLSFAFSGGIRNISSRRKAAQRAVGEGREHCWSSPGGKSEQPLAAAWRRAFYVWGGSQRRKQGLAPCFPTCPWTCSQEMPHMWEARRVPISHRPSEISTPDSPESVCYLRPMSGILRHQTEILSQGWGRISSQGWNMSYDQVHAKVAQRARGRCCAPPPDSCC
jgi:hypothetical protein